MSTSVVAGLTGSSENFVRNWSNSKFLKFFKKFLKILELNLIKKFLLQSELELQLFMSSDQESFLLQTNVWHSTALSDSARLGRQWSRGVRSAAFLSEFESDFANFRRDLFASKAI